MRELSLCIITSFIFANKTFDKYYSKHEFVTHKVHTLFYLCEFGFHFSTRRINVFLRFVFNNMPSTSYICFHLDRN